MLLYISEQIIAILFLTSVGYFVCLSVSKTFLCASYIFSKTLFIEEKAQTKFHIIQTEISREFQLNTQL